MSTRINGGQYIQITSILTSCLEMVTFEPTITFLDTSSIVFWIWENERSQSTTSFCADFWCVNDMNAIKGWVEEFEKCKQRIFEYFDLVPDFIFNVCQLFKNSEQLTELLFYSWTGAKILSFRKLFLCCRAGCKSEFSIQGLYLFIAIQIWEIYTGHLYRFLH